jgi:hypothetical protein
MSVTIKYSEDGLNFSLLGASGVIMPEQQVPETGVAYVSTRIGPRVVTFPHYGLEDTARVKTNTVFALVAEPTAISGKCASASNIADSYEDDDEDEEEDEDADADLDEDEDDEYDTDGDEEDEVV